jgi:1-acyl-sn-glycerol-3-phosphate acyltransferase
MALLLVLFTIVGLVICLFRPFHPENAILISRLTLPSALKILGIEIETKNLHYLFENQPSVVVANHQSSFDILIFPLFLPIRSVSVGKKSLRWIPFWGWIFFLSGQIAIDRHNKKKANDTLAVAQKKLLQDKVNVVIFPEGTRSRGRGLLPFKSGSFRTAILAQVPVIPLVLSDFITHIDLKKWGKSGKLILEALPPIKTNSLQTEDARELANQSHQLMKTTLDQHRLLLQTKFQS